MDADDLLCPKPFLDEHSGCQLVRDDDLWLLAASLSSDWRPGHVPWRPPGSNSLSTDTKGP